MNKEIKEALNALLKTIQETKEYTEFKEAEKNWEKATDAQKLLSDFLEARQTLGVFQEGTFPGIEDQKTKVKNLYDKVSTNKVIQDWMDAQDKYQHFIWDQGDFLSDELGFEFSPKPTGGCCG